MAAPARSIKPPPEKLIFVSCVPSGVRTCADCVVSSGVCVCADQIVGQKSGGNLAYQQNRGAIALYVRALYN